jgi:signal transduction histidine kinase
VGVVILVEDVTEQTLIERSKDEFFFIASHELRTPLTAIRGNASLMQQYYPQILKDKNLAEIVDDIHTSAIRLIELVNDFLDASALEQGKIQFDIERFSLAGVIDEVLRELQGLANGKGIALIADDSLKHLPKVTADRKRVKQVVYNLVGNALKFTDSGTITVSGQTSGNFVHCTVTDTGRGMAKESQKLLFRKFQQAGSTLLARDATSGTGLGLYISKLIIELLNGKISLERSEIGKGSTFGFTLPKA